MIYVYARLVGAGCQVRTMYNRPMTDQADWELVGIAANSFEAEGLRNKWLLDHGFEI